MEYPFGGFDFMFIAGPIFITVIFVFVFGIIIFAIVRGIGEWNKNNHSPVLTVEATIIAKRMSISEHSRSGEMDHSTSSTYYVTFEVESGDRMELYIPDKKYGLLVEGDKGKLTFQGTRYKGFERIRI